VNLKEHQSSQKLMGAYYTPNAIVDYMIKWAVDEGVQQKILEPSAGDGQFLRRMTNINKGSSITAIEINQKESEKIPTSLGCGVNVFNNDFYDYYEEHRTKEFFDVVIGNPPYIRYQFLTDSQREFQSDILRNNNLRPNKLINSWLAFSVASIEFLKPGGRFAFVLPTDLLQVSYAKQLRTFFKDTFSELNIVTFENLVFDDIQQDILLVMGKKRIYSGEEIRLRTVHINDIEDLEQDLESFAFDDYTDFSSDKWSSLNLDNEFRKYYDIELKKLTEPITNFAKIEVGITTGNNNYFVINNEIVATYNLEDYIRPLLGRSIETYGITYTKEDLQRNSNSNKNTWLLDFNNKKLNLGAQKYIKYGEDNALNSAYKLRIRNNWFEVPSIWEPDAFFLRRIGQFPKLIKNDSHSVSTDTFHRLRLSGLSTYDIKEIIFLFYSSPSLLSIELEGRVFGGGALEILPGDMKNIRLPKIFNLPNKDNLFEQLDKKIRENASIFEIVKWVDEQIATSCETDIDFGRTYLAWMQKNQKRCKVQ